MQTLLASIHRKRSRQGNLWLSLSCRKLFSVHRLEALSVDDRWAGLIILLLGDPHLLEGREGSQNGTTNPDGVFSLGGSDDLDLHRGWGEGSDFLLHSVGDTWVHGSTTRLERKLANRNYR